MKLAITEADFNKKRNKQEKILSSGRPSKKGASYMRLLNDFTNELKKCYKPYKSLKEIEKEENLWDTYPVQDFSPAKKESFTFYFCGWLQYYDEIVRNNAIDHTLHFKWDKGKGEVEVYICPRPRKVHEDPETCPPASNSSDPIPPKAPPPPYP
jgi:hypothetical protein